MEQDDSGLCNYPESWTLLLLLLLLYKAAVVCVFYLVQKCWMQKPLNFANNLVNMISEFIENEAFTYQDFDF
jgi:hypothetical protein